MNSKNQNSNFCNKFIYELNFYELMCLNSLGNLWFHSSARLSALESWASLGQVVASYVGQWNVPLQQGSDPCFLMSLVLDVFAEPLFCRIVVKMRNLTESVYFAQELRLLLLMA